tara:strand:+ start:81 stop:836 length:756 start_codon:yes stop_codon:yes gene_type:complete
MEYPNIEYILTFGSNKTEDDKYVKGMFIAKKQAIVNGDLQGLVISPDLTREFSLDGTNLEIHEKYIKDKDTDTIYSWNDLIIGIEDESIFLITHNSDSTKNKKIWELPQLLFSYLEIIYCYIYSIIIDNSQLCIQMIKYRTTLHNKNRVLWSKPVILPDISEHTNIIQPYQNKHSVTVKLPKIRSYKGLDETQTKKILDSIYFIINKHKIFLKDIELTKKDNTLQVITKKIHSEGHILGFIYTDTLDMGDI